jgi:hypothetical protein
MSARQRIVAYPPRSRAVAKLGYNVDTNHGDDAHMAFAAAGGADIVRFQFNWKDIENVDTGVYSLPTTYQATLAACAAHGLQPAIVHGFGPPYKTIGTFTVGVAGAASGSTVIPGSWSISVPDPSTWRIFAGGSTLPVGKLSSVSAYYGDLVVAADSGSMTLAHTTNVTLAAGTVIQIQQLRYGLALTDNDPMIPAYANAGRYVAQQIAARGVTGWVTWWNEYVWSDDRSTAPGTFWDVKPGFVTLSSAMKAYLQAGQALALPNGVKLINGVSDKSGGNTLVGRAPGSNFEFEGAHPYGYDNMPEYQGWDLYTAPYQALNAADDSSTFKGMAYSQDTTLGSPKIMVTENGCSTSDDTLQARCVTRQLLSGWGMGHPTVITRLDSGNTDQFQVAPNLVARQAYTALQRCSKAGVLGRMGGNALNAPLPCIVGWSSETWPLMATTITGDTPGHSVVYAWQRTHDPANTGRWSVIPSPPAQPASIAVPSGLHVAECFDVVTGSTVTTTGPTSGVATVPVTDSPVAVRFAPV